MEPFLRRTEDRASGGSRTPQRLVLVVATLGSLARLLVAATTGGTDDVRLFANFARAAVSHGPLGIYHVDFPGLPYNHGPLTSWMLVLFGHLADAGVPFGLLIRMPASLADLVSTVLVFELLRERRGDASAAAAAVVFALAPLGLIVSGFHGNTDPLFVMLVLLSLFWVLEGRPASAGLALGLALSVKAVPVVFVPVLLVLAWRRGRGQLGRFVLGGGLVFALLWLPALVVARGDFVHSYLGYAGVDVRQWGLSQLLHDLGVPDPSVIAIGTDLRFLVVLVAAAVPAVLLARARGRDPVVLAALPGCLFLFLSPAFSMQYLVWALAASLLATRLWVSCLFVATASIFAVAVYDEWNEAVPWHWNVANAVPLTDVLLPVMFVTWISLGLCCLAALLPTRSTSDPVSSPNLHERPVHASI